MRPSRQMQPLFRPWPAGGPSVTVVIIAASIGMALAQWIVAALDGGDIFKVNGMLKDVLGLSVNGIKQGHLWQFLSFTVLHSGPGPFHLLTNVFLLYFAGREVEPIIGRKHFVALYLLGNVVGGIAQWGAMSVGWAPADVTVVGISAGVATIVAAYATILPDLDVTVNFFFVFPVRTQARVIGISAMVLTGGLWASNWTPAIGPAGMLAGIVVGWAYMKELGFGNPLAIQRFLYRRRQREARVARMPAAQFISEEIDPILEKISREGVQSLTRAERKVLEAGRVKISSRSESRE